MSDEYIIAFDKSDKDLPVLVVLKPLKRGGQNVLVKHIIGEQADLLYYALTNQEVEISIIYRTEDEAINNVINAWNERKNETAVTLKPQTGHWEWVQYDSNPNIGNWHCSECRTIIPHMPEETDNTPIYKWCPICGAKMVGEQEEVEKL